MSRSNKRKQVWSIPRWFKRKQNRKTKMRLKENTQLALTRPDAVAVMRLRKSHRWGYF